jgi:hypothetical protein
MGQKYKTIFVIGISQFVKYVIRISKKANILVASEGESLIAA